MRPVTAQTVISAPREEIFDYVADLSNRVAWTDHYMKDFRLARANPRGVGAAARFLFEPPFLPFTYVEIAIAEAERPRLIVEEGRWGRIGRSRLHAEYRFTSESRSHTRVEFIAWTEPGHRWDALKESLGVRRWLRRQAKTSLGRLRMIFEEPPAGALARTTVAAWEPLKSSRFGA